MKIYYTTDKSDSLYHDCISRCGIPSTDTTQYALEDFIRNANNRYRNVNTEIWKSTGEWEYDDSNYTDMPYATANMVANQQDYEIPSNAQKIDRFEVLDINGDWQKLDPIDKSEIEAALTQFEETAGLPKYYDMVGNSVLLYPKPSATFCTLENGIRVYFSRDISKFLITDTTKQPGFISDFHPLISIGAAIDWCNIWSIERVNNLKSDYNEMMNNLREFYGRRQRELKPSIKPKYKRHI